MSVFGEVQEYFGVNSLQESAALMEIMERPQLAIKDMDMKHQYVNHWRKEEILWSDAKGKKGQTPYSFFDYVWLRLVLKMRDFGLPFDMIRKVRDQLQMQLSLQDLFEVMDSAGSDLQQLSEEDQELYRELESEVKSGKLQGEVMLFALIMNICIGTRVPVSFLVNTDGNMLPFYGSEPAKYYENPQFLDFIQHTHFSLSLTETIKEILQAQDLEFLVNRFPVISEEEKEVLELIREGQLTELTVTFTKNNQIELVKATKEHQIDLEDRFMDVITKEGYHDIHFTTHRGKAVSFHSTTKTRFNNKRAKK